MNDLNLRLTDLATALDLDGVYWEEQAERDDLDPTEAARLLGRAEALQWAAKAIRGGGPEGDDES